MVRDRGNGLKAQPAVYRWTNGAGWLKATSREVMRMEVVNCKPMIRPEGTLALYDGEEVRTASTKVEKGLGPKGPRVHDP